MKYDVPVYKVQLVRDSEQAAEPMKLATGPAEAGQVVKEYLATADRENFIVLMLDVKGHVIGVHTVAVGTLNAALVHPREVFKAPILCNAATIILGHNHPSGVCDPSQEDIEMTHRLVKCGKLMGIEVVDHVIVAGDCVQSLYEHGYFLEE